MKKPTNKLLKKGYILFPKALLEEQLKKTKKANDAFEAFILTLTHVNYSDIECIVRHHTFKCLRGESALTVTHWAKIFGWTRARTRYFFNKMFEEGIIEKLNNPYTTHIRIPDYDQLVGRSARDAARAQANGVTFEAFWEKYHDITRKQKINIGRGHREWKKLPAYERTLAMNRIDEYYDNLNDVKFCMQAATYLADKAFLNEYNY